MDVINVGGGTWSYGSGTDSSGWKLCYSDYENPSSSHSATAVLGNANDKEYANAGSWANANVDGNWGSTCHAYWSNY
ncbi:lactococcin 972 family bacteriocin [Streptantibioticus rubrisoli]|uniref:Lactococcin 972 family bacteriocin n=2 Tax=Streptantibioticus rubrisoli TaxID=1387313 RepID=A0ABT1PH29_9ACTN|nr:lactococcin 972 family bacteriocin [Streptantibioticus rubrisoli]